ncbi:hypothetical protein EDC96DRAFT_591609 [Choanephora cucurbitarum]|nr:hypothetical protein EDC96DRAFT_591609 [Choanephora cucurbitarum]
MPKTDETHNGAVLSGVVASPFKSILAVEIISANISCSHLDRALLAPFLTLLLCLFSLSLFLSWRLRFFCTLLIPPLKLVNNQLLSLTIANNPNFNIQHSAFSIQHSAFSIQHSAFSIQHSAFSIQHSTIDNRQSTINNRQSTFNIQHSTFNIQPVIVFYPSR